MASRSDGEGAYRGISLGHSKEGNETRGVGTPAKGQIAEEGRGVHGGGEHDEGSGVSLRHGLDDVPHGLPANRITHDYKGNKTEGVGDWGRAVTGRRGWAILLLRQVVLSVIPHMKASSSKP